MSLLNAYSRKAWMVTDEADVREFFDQLQSAHAGGKRPSFARYQVALVHGSSANWFMAVLVLTEAAGDDSEWILHKTQAWFAQCGAGAVNEFESITIRGDSMEASVNGRSTILASFGTLGTTVTSAQQANDEDSVASAVPDAQVGDLIIDWLWGLPLWITSVVGTVLFSVAAGATWHLSTDGFTWWSLLSGFAALVMLFFTALVIVGNRAPVAGAAGGGTAGGMYISIMISVGCSLLTVWLFSRDGFFWWLLLPGSLALLGVIATLICFFGYCEERRIHNR